MAGKRLRGATKKGENKGEGKQRCISVHLSSQNIGSVLTFSGKNLFRRVSWGGKGRRGGEGSKTLKKSELPRALETYGIGILDPQPLKMGKGMEGRSGKGGGVVGRRGGYHPND